MRGKRRGGGYKDLLGVFSKFLRRMNRTSICLILFLAFMFIGCSGVSSQVATNVQTDSADESYAVYSALLKDIKLSPENGEKVNLLIINETTDTDRSTGTPVDQVLRNLNVDLTPEFKAALEDYKVKNKVPQKLTKSFDLEQALTFISRAEFSAFFKGNNLRKNWEAFYDKYPHSAGFITLSKVGFDAEKKHAFVYVELSCGGLCADAGYRLLTKEQGVWKETKRATAWVS
ncbi:MAG: hypothetical protein ACR2GD_05605 [Pyrinomonadaceae bacterium]